MNKKMIGLSALAVLSLAACNKNVENGVEAHGTTHAGVTVTVNGSGSSALRADEYPTDGTHQVDNDGSEAESKVSSIYVLMGADQKTFGTSDFVASAGTPLSSYSSTQTKSYRLKPWLTAAGTKNMAVILNGTSPFNAYKVTADNGATAVYGQDNPTTFDAKKYGEALNEELSSLSTDDAFVMSSKMESKTVHDGISKQAVKDADGQNATGEDLANNLFHFNLERLVCKGIVVKGTALTNQIEDNSGTVDLSSLSFASINGATKIYVLANKAGERQMTASDGAPVVQDGINGKYQGFESAINGSSVAPTATKAVAQDLVRLGNIGITAKQDGASGYAPKAVNEAAKFDVSKASAVYFLENSASEVGSALKTKLTAEQLKTTTDNNGAGYYRFAYAKVYATVKPSKLFYLDGETLKSGDATAAKLAADGTFYQGATDGLLYATPQAAKKNGQTKVFIYNKGRCFYRALWNRQFSDTKHELTTYASTRRNNIYVININSFKKLGMPFDPSDPNDPNLPAPGAKIVGDDASTVDVPTLPDGSDGVTAVGVQSDGTVDKEGVEKDDPRIDKTETYMAVTATVLKWNVVTRGVDLE